MKTNIVKRMLLITGAVFFAFLLALVIGQAGVRRLPPENSVALFWNTYFGAIGDSVDSFAERYFRINREDVERYQITLVKQSVNDYVDIVRMQQEELLTHPALASIGDGRLSERELAEVKDVFYRMHIENPYLKSLTFFNADGNTLLHLYMEKGWNITLRTAVIEELRRKKSLTLHSESEEMLYSLNYYTKNGNEIIVSSRTDRNFVYDIVSYYQLADKTFFLRDEHDTTRIVNVEASGSVEARHDAIRLIARYAQNKTRARIDVAGVPHLEVSMVGKTYPDYFALILLSITALVITAVCALLVLSAYGIRLLALKLMASPSRTPETGAAIDTNEDAEDKVAEPVEDDDYDIEEYDEDEEPAVAPAFAEAHEPAVEAAAEVPAADNEDTPSPDELTDLPTFQVPSLSGKHRRAVLEKERSAAREAQRHARSEEIKNEIGDIFSRFDEALSEIIDEPAPKTNTNEANQPAESGVSVANNEESGRIASRFSFSLDERKHLS